MSIGQPTVVVTEQQPTEQFTYKMYTGDFLILNRLETNEV